MHCVAVEGTRHVADLVAARISSENVSEDAGAVSRTPGAGADEGRLVVSHSRSWQRSQSSSAAFVF